MGLIGVPEVGVEGLAGSVLSIPQCCRGLINAWLPGVLRTDSAARMGLYAMTGLDGTGLLDAFSA